MKNEAEIFEFKATLNKDESSSLMWYWQIEVPSEFISALTQKDRRVLCTLNNAPFFHAALTPDGNGNYFIIINKERRKKLNIEIGDSVDVKVQNDNSEYGIGVPEVFKELCYQDPEGNKIFHELTIGKQRSLLHLMGKPKSEQKQLEKALIIFDYLKSVQGKLDFKELNLAFKENRFKL